jgi:hypothetical protein
MCGQQADVGSQQQQRESEPIAGPYIAGWSGELCCIARSARAPDFWKIGVGTAAGSIRDRDTPGFRFHAQHIG